MEEILMWIMIVAGVILIFIPSGRLKRNRKVHQMPPKMFWRLVAMWLAGAALIAGGFVVGGVI